MRSTNFRVSAFWVVFLMSSSISCATTFEQLSDAVRFRNTAVQFAQEQKDQAQGGLWLAKSYMLPQLSLSIQGAQSDDPMQVFGMKVMQRQASFADFGASEFNPSAPNTQPHALNFPKEYTNWGSGLNLQIPLFTGGKIAGAKAMANATYTAADHAKKGAVAQALFELYQVKAEWKSANAMYKVAIEAEKTYQEILKVTQKMNREGLVQKTDLLLADYKLNQVQVQKLQAQDRIDMALDKIKLLAKIPIEEPLKIEETVENENPNSIEQVQCSKLNNPNLSAFEAQGQVKNAQIQVAQSGLWPNLGAIGKLVANHPDHPSVENWSYTVGIQVEWNLMNGSAWAQKSMAHAEKRMWQAQYSQTLAETEAKCIQTKRVIKTSQFEIQNQDKAIVQASETLRLAKLKYEQGLATLAELLALQSELEKVQAQKVMAEQNLAVQKTALLWISGQL